MNKTKGQSTVEYILLVTAVITVIFLATGRNSVFQQRLGNTINLTTNGMQTMAANLTRVVTP